MWMVYTLLRCDVKGWGQGAPLLFSRAATVNVGMAVQGSRGTVAGYRDGVAGLAEVRRHPASGDVRDDLMDAHSLSRGFSAVRAQLQPILFPKGNLFW